jgi:hypothetical protein
MNSSGIPSLFESGLRGLNNAERELITAADNISSGPPPIEPVDNGSSKGGDAADVRTGPDAGYRGTLLGPDLAQELVRTIRAQTTFLSSATIIQVADHLNRTVFHLLDPKAKD